MREFFDSSVLIAAFLGDHPHHVPSAKLFAAAQKKHAACGVHSLAEVYSALTSMPLRPMVAPSQAVLFLEDIRKRLQIICLNESEYFEAATGLSDRGFAGGRIYDALLLRCAMKFGAQIIYTWNLKHFQQIAPDLADQLRSPS